MGWLGESEADLTLGGACWLRGAQAEGADSNPERRSGLGPTNFGSRVNLVANAGG